MAKHTSSPLNQPKGPGYYANIRNDCLAVVKKQGLAAERVLELGCGAGNTSKVLKATVGATYYAGVELNAEAAEQAKSVLDTVYVANIERQSPEKLGIAPGQFDLLVAIDVLEHLYDPWETLARWASVIKPGGKFLVSMPNIQNINLIARLIAGFWDYEEEGLLDSTHLRFFTLKSLVSLVRGAGLEVSYFSSVIGPAIDVNGIKDNGNNVHIGDFSVSGLNRHQMMGLFTYQYIVIALKPVPPVTDSAAS